MPKECVCVCVYVYVYVYVCIYSLKIVLVNLPWWARNLNWFTLSPIRTLTHCMTVWLNTHQIFVSGQPLLTHNLWFKMQIWATFDLLAKISKLIIPAEPTWQLQRMYPTPMIPSYWRRGYHDSNRDKMSLANLHLGLWKPIEVTFNCVALKK